MIRNLVAFGCGWTYGVELDDPTTEAYPALIAAEHGWTVENCAVPGTTLADMLEDVRSWIANTSTEHVRESLILIGLPSESKGLDADTNVEEYYKQKVLEFGLIAMDKDVTLIQFNVVAKNYKVKVRSLIDSSSALEMLVIRDKPRKDPLFTEHKFPNAKGHAIVSEFLINKLDSVILDA